LGYEQYQCYSKVIAILADGKLVDTVPEGQMVQVILDRTVFYGEKGGQVGDNGCILAFWKSDSDHWLGAFEVNNTQMDGDLIVHIGQQFIHGEDEKHFPNIVLKVGDEVSGYLNDYENRLPIQRAHTATHLLHSVLRKTLGSHAEQQGSRVDVDLLRFDFTNHQAVGKETLQKIEREVNRLIFHPNEVKCEEMTIEEARKIGAIMLFGEKYPEKVRVVQIGEGWTEIGLVSIELCGGTHVQNTSEIGLFKIISEESVAAGIRRITALTGMKAVEKMQAEAAILQQLAQTLKVPADDVVAKVENLAGQVKQLRKQLAAPLAGRGGKCIASDAANLIASAEIVNGIKLIACELPDMDADAVRQLIDQIKQKTDSVFMLFALRSDGKVTLLSGASSDIADKYNAVDFIRRVTPLIGGKGGGGRPDFGQGGGSNAAKLPEVFAEAKKFLGQQS
jgi:alanyl-tRNA synthetase